MRWPLFRARVAERSMEPALRPGDWLLARRTTRIRPGQIVVARHPDRPGFLLVKRAARRVAGDGPGGTGGGSPPCEEEAGGGWWLTSDNPFANAADSRRFGPVPARLIEGRVLLRYRRRRAG